MLLYWMLRERTYSRSASLLSGDSIEPHGKPCAVSRHSCSQSMMPSAVLSMPIS